MTFRISTMLSFFLMIAGLGVHTAAAGGDVPDSRSAASVMPRLAVAGTAKIAAGCVFRRSRS